MTTVGVLWAELFPSVKLTTKKQLTSLLAQLEARQFNLQVTGLLFQQDCMSPLSQKLWRHLFFLQQQWWTVDYVCLLYNCCSWVCETSWTSDHHWFNAFVLQGMIYVEVVICLLYRPPLLHYIHVICFQNNGVLNVVGFTESC